MENKGKFSSFIYSFLLIGALVMRGCRNISPDNQNNIQSQNEKLQQDESTAVTMAESTEFPEPEVEEAEIDECVACHTDKELLILSANPEVEVQSENEGAG